MKFYQFNQPYFALIGAEAEERATEIYCQSVVVDMFEVDDEIIVEEITEERALESFIEDMSSNFGIFVQSLNDIYNKDHAIMEFDEIKSTKEPIFLIDGDLF